MMIKNKLERVELQIKFGSKGIFPVKGILKSVGISDKGTKWFSLLVSKSKMSKTETGNSVREFYYIERTFKLDSVQNPEVISNEFANLQPGK